MYGRGGKYLIIISKVSAPASKSFFTISVFPLCEVTCSTVCPVLLYKLPVSLNQYNYYEHTYTLSV